MLLNLLAVLVLLAFCGFVAYALGWYYLVGMLVTLVVMGAAVRIAVWSLW